MFQVGIDASAPVYGPAFGGPGGAIALPGASRFRHRFGGDSWLVADSSSSDLKPSLILTLDLSDPILSDLQALGLEELPLCSYVAYDIGAPAQFYRINRYERRVSCIHRGAVVSENPNAAVLHLKEKSLTLVPMTDEDYPTSESAYWNASDLFLGGRRFIRLLGPPLWLYAVETVQCICSDEMKYVGALGYESRPPYSQLIENEPVFFGEMGLYWFMCQRCLTFAVTSQSS